MNETDSKNEINEHRTVLLDDGTAVAKPARDGGAGRCDPARDAGRDGDQDGRAAGVIGYVLSPVMQACKRHSMIKNIFVLRKWNDPHLAS